MGNGQPDPRTSASRGLDDLREALLLIKRDINTSTVPKDFPETELLNEVKRFLTHPDEWQHIAALRPVLGLFSGPNGQISSVPQQAAALRDAAVSVAPPERAEKWRTLLSLDPPEMSVRLRTAHEPASDPNKRKLAAELAGLIALVIEKQTNNQQEITTAAVEPPNMVDTHDPLQPGSPIPPDEGPSTDPPTTSGPTKRHHHALLAGAAGAAVVTLIIIVIAWARTSSDDDHSGQSTEPTTSTVALSTTPSTTTTSSTTTTPSDDVTQAMPLTFDDLLGGAGTVEVYEDYTSAARDTGGNGTFFGGQDTTAICVATGRTINSRPEDGEPPVSSDKWFRINGAPGQTQYATAVYVKDSQTLIDALPPCT